MKRSSYCSKQKKQKAKTNNNEKTLIQKCKKQEHLKNERWETGKLVNHIFLSVHLVTKSGLAS